MIKFLCLMLVAFACIMHQQIASAAPIRKHVTRLVKVGVELDGDSSTKSSSIYKLEFTNLSYKLVCQVKFRVELPETAKLIKYWNMDPVAGTKDKFTLPMLEQLYPGRAFTNAAIKLSGVGQPKVTVLDTIDVLSTKQCPTDPML